MPQGPLLWGHEEFDVPPRRRPRWVLWLVGTVLGAAGVLVLVGLFAGVGPLRILGLTTQDLTAVGYRATANPNVIQVAVALPPQGLCRSDDVVVTALEQSNRIEIRATATRSRASSCETVAVAGNNVWIDTALRFPLLERSVIRVSDRQPLSRQS
jgi:hypothetical protein